MSSRMHGRRIGIYGVIVIVAGIAAGARAAQTPAGTVPAAGAFARHNLHAWAFEEYDGVARTPAERAKLLKSLGFTKAAYIARNVERMKEFDAYLAGYRDQGLELVAVWSPVNTAAPLEEPHIRMFLDAVERHRIRAQWWITLERFAKVTDDGAVDRAVAVLKPLVAEASTRGLRVALYGHGRDAWFTQPENEIAIIERLRSEGIAAPVGLAYNFHHAHSQLDRFQQVFPSMLPHLWAVNLNGMKRDGPMILHIGEGDRERDMIATIHRSRYRGPVGLLHHQRNVDAAVVLRRNMAGLRDILAAIGDAAGAATYVNER